MGCGVAPDHWWAKGAGADMELGKTLEPLAPLRKKLNVINGLFNKKSTGQGIHPAQTGNLLTGVSFKKGSIIRSGISMDQVIANHLVQTVDASRLMGATVIVTGLSSEIAQTLVTIGVDLTRMKTVGDLQGGIEEAERLLGYQIARPSV